jgi:hypothetical protein
MKTLHWHVLCATMFTAIVYDSKWHCVFTIFLQQVTEAWGCGGHQSIDLRNTRDASCTEEDCEFAGTNVEVRTLVSSQ